MTSSEAGDSQYLKPVNRKNEGLTEQYSKTISRAPASRTPADGRSFHGTLRQAVSAVQDSWAPSGILLTAYLVFVVINSLVMVQRTDIAVDTHLLVRRFGSPTDAIERIQEDNFVEYSRLQELAGDPSLSPQLRAVYRHAPLLLAPHSPRSFSNDVFIGVYYTINTSQFEGTRTTTISYWFYATDESGGTIIPRRLALFGQPIDRELVYRVRLLDDEVISAHYQAPGHRLVRFHYDGSHHPVFAIASANHNFRPVLPRELQLTDPVEILVPLPRDELAHDPAHDPDFVALAAREALVQYGLNLSQYVYVEFQNPYHDGVATVSAKVRGRWYHLHEQIAGLTRPGYNQVGIPIGFTPEPGDIEEVRITARSPRDVDVEVLSVYIYPRLQVAM